MNVISVKFITLLFFLFANVLFAEGNITYTLHKSNNPTEDELDAYKQITKAMDSALYYYNKYTDLSKYINVYYNTGVPTAEASSNGDLRFGKDRNYMYVGTAMHEIAHTIGMGTTTEYRNMFSNGVFLGEKAQILLKELDGSDAELHGDSQHFWPYGINYRSEVKSEKDLINHAKIVNAMYQDIFKEAFYFQGHLQNISTKKCMGITETNSLELMDCSDSSTFIKMYSVGEPTSYRIQLGKLSLDVPNESTQSGVQLSTYGYNGGTHQRMYKELVDKNDTTIFYLKIVKSNLYVKVDDINLKQEKKSEELELFQWKFYNNAEENTKDSIELKDTTIVQFIKKSYYSNKVNSEPSAMNVFDLKGRFINKGYNRKIKFFNVQKD